MGLGIFYLFVAQKIFPTSILSTKNFGIFKNITTDVLMLSIFLCHILKKNVRKKLWY